MSDTSPQPAFTVWRLDPIYYQYAWENEVCEARCATLAEAVECARALVKAAVQLFAKDKRTAEEALKSCELHMDDFWIDGPGVSIYRCQQTNELVFDKRAETLAAIRMWFAQYAQDEAESATRNSPEQPGTANKPSG